MSGSAKDTINTAHAGAPDATISPASTVQAYPTGLKNGGRGTLVPVDGTQWYPLPLSPLPNRNAMTIQNQGTVEVKIGYTNAEPGYKGAIIAAQGERFYDITDAVVIYAKSAGASTNLWVEELS